MTKTSVDLPPPRRAILGWILSMYLGATVGALQAGRGWMALNPAAALMSVVGAIIINGLNVLMVAVVTVSLVLCWRRKYAWSNSLAFLGCAYVAAVMIRLITSQ